ncbi:MAG: hypothetical protein QXT93_11235, partial [Thermofilum sp.]
MVSWLMGFGCTFTVPVQHREFSALFSTGNRGGYVYKVAVTNCYGGNMLPDYVWERARALGAAELVAE